MKDTPARGSPHHTISVDDGSSNLGARLPLETVLQALRDSSYYFISPLISSFFLHT